MSINETERGGGGEGGGAEGGREGGRAHEHLLSSRVFIFAERCSTRSLIKSHMSGLASGTVCVCVLEGDCACVCVCFMYMTTAAVEVEGPRT